MKRCFGKAILGWMIALLLVTGAGAESSVWVVKTNKTAIYLAGSCHVLRKSDHPLPAEFEAAYTRVREVIFEVPPGDLEGPEYMAKLMDISVYKDGTTLKEHLTPAVYAKTEKFCRERNYPFEQYQAFRPWMLSMLLAIQELARIGVAVDYGVDRYFYEKALQDGKKISGLETADEQLGFLSSMDKMMGNDQVSETVDDLTELKSKVGDMLDAWRRGDEAGIEAFNLGELKNYPQLYKVLIDDRNKKWAKKIESMIRDGRTAMVIVGVGHLAGTGSLVNLLRRKGYSVVKLK